VKIWSAAIYRRFLMEAVAYSNKSGDESPHSKISQALRVIA
jgi:hypothetical protein